METHGRVLNTVATDALVLKYLQVFSIHSSEWIFIAFHISLILYKSISFIANKIRKQNPI